MPVIAHRHPVFFVAGIVFCLAAHGLAALAFAGFFIHLRPAGYLRALNAMAFLLLAASALAGCAYAVEAWVALSSHNPFEKYAFLRSRVAGPTTDLVHLAYPVFKRLPWAPYWWAYYFQFIANLCPQLFWIPIFRRRASLAFCVASVAVLAIYWERLLAFCARFL